MTAKEMLDMLADPNEVNLRRRAFLSWSLPPSLSRRRHGNENPS